MIIKEAELSEFSQKILWGINKALRKLVEERAAQGRSLVISENGEVKIVPAKDLLQKVSGQGLDPFQPKK